jgi:hypothetical protein
MSRRDETPAKVLFKVAAAWAEVSLWVICCRSWLICRISLMACGCFFEGGDRLGFAVLEGHPAAKRRSMVINPLTLDESFI